MQIELLREMPAALHNVSGGACGGASHKCIPVNEHAAAVLQGPVDELYGSRQVGDQILLR